MSQVYQVKRENYVVYVSGEEYHYYWLGKYYKSNNLKYHKSLSSCL